MLRMRLAERVKSLCSMKHAPLFLYVMFTRCYYIAVISKSQWLNWTKQRKNNGVKHRKKTAPAIDKKSGDDYNAQHVCQFVANK